MRPELERELNKALRRERLRIALVATVIAVPVLALFILFGLPHEAGPVVPVTLTAFESRPSDDGKVGRLVLEREDGGRPIRLVAAPGDARLQPGAKLCLVEMRQYLTGRVHYSRVPLARCDAD